MPAKGGAGRPCVRTARTGPTSSSSGAASSAWSPPGGPLSAAWPRRSSIPTRAAAPPGSRPGCWPPSPNSTTARRCCSASTSPPPRAIRRSRPSWRRRADGTSASAPAAPWPSRSTPTTGPTCANCTPCNAARAWSRSGSPAGSAAAWNRCSHPAYAAGCGSTATTRSIHDGWPPRWWRRASGPGSSSTAGGPSGSRSRTAGPQGSPLPTAGSRWPIRSYSPPAASAAGSRGCRSMSCPRSAR